MNSPTYIPDGTMGYHNMQPEDIIQVKLDLITHALKRAGIPVADYMKYIRSGEFIYDSADHKKTVRPDTASQKNVAESGAQVSDLDRAGRKSVQNRPARDERRKGNV